MLFVFIQAGQRAAIEIMDELRPQSLSSKDYVLLKKSSSDTGNLTFSMTKGMKNGGIIEELWFSNVFRWTMVLPLSSVCLAYAVFKLRETYCHLVVPR